MINKNIPLEFESFYNELLCELAKKGTISTKRNNRLNRIRLEKRKIFVATKKSGSEFKEIELKFIKKTFESLLDGKEISQQYLKKTLKIYRTAFIISAFSCLNYIKYNETNNSITIINQKPNRQ